MKVQALDGAQFNKTKREVIPREGVESGREGDEPVDDTLRE